MGKKAFFEIERESWENRRQCTRVSLKKPVQYETLDHSSEGGTLGYDISQNGIRICFHDYLPKGSKLWLSIQLPQQQIIECSGIICWINKERFTEGYQAGLRFEPSENLKELQKIINQYVKSCSIR